MIASIGAIVNHSGSRDVVVYPSILACGFTPRAFTFSADSTRVATGGYDGKIRLFGVAQGELIRTFDSVPLTLPPAATAQQ